MEQYDIFISYKRKSLPTANNLYYRLTTRGYSTFFDLEEMRRDNYNVQLLNYIENAKDVFIILEEGSLDGCKKENWESEDWFCHEIAFALEKGKNIIPILLGDYKMPREDFFPDKLKELSLKHSPDFSFSFFDAYLDKLIEKKFITSEAHVQNKATSVFKFYSNENCQVYKEGKMVCSLEGMLDEPYYLPVPRKGDYRFKVVNFATKESQIKDLFIDSNEEKKIQIEWDTNRTTNKNNQKIRKTWRFVVGSISLIILLSVIVHWCFNRPATNSYVALSSVGDTICISIDLGLPSNTLWGDRNFGADNPYNTGDFYSWDDMISIIDKGLSSHTSISNNTNSDMPEITNQSWDLPTSKQFDELITCCKWKWINNKGKEGYLVIGPNGNKIFLPASGCVFKKDGYKYYNQYGYYWAADDVNHSSTVAAELIIGFDDITIANGKKYVGRSVRPVIRKKDN